MEHCSMFSPLPLAREDQGEGSSPLARIDHQCSTWNTEPMSWHPLDGLSQEQLRKLKAYASLLKQTNEAINLVSRTTVDRIWEHHILHCLVLRRRSFPAGSRVVDWGTGGGLPAIPLAISFPQVQFVAIDSTTKKVMAVAEMAKALDLDNLEAQPVRAESWNGAAHYSVSRATAPLPDLWKWHRRVARPLDAGPEDWAPGLLCLKGGDLSEEMRCLSRAYPHVSITSEPVQEYLPEPHFEEKYLLHVTK